VHITLINLTLDLKGAHIMLFIADVKLYQLQAFYYRHIAFNVARLLLNENGNMPIYIKKQHTLTHSALRERVICRESAGELLLWLRCRRPAAAA